MNFRRHSMHFPDFWKPSETSSAPVYQNLDQFQEDTRNQNQIPVSRKLGSSYARHHNQKQDSSLRRRIARTQSERKPSNNSGFRIPLTGFEIPRIQTDSLHQGVVYSNLSVPQSNVDQQRKWSMSLERKRSLNHHRPSDYENLSQFTYRPEHRSCSDLTQPCESFKPTTVSVSFHNLNQGYYYQLIRTELSKNQIFGVTHSLVLISDLEYGPGIVEKLRAKFSKMSGAQKQQQDKSFASQTKKYSSCDDLLSESDSVMYVLVE